MLKILVFKGRRKAGSLPLEHGEYTVGRAITCDLQLDDPVVSREHARLTASPMGLVLQDLGGKAGLLVNDEAVPRARLLPGDRVQIGPYTLVIADDDSGIAASLDVPTVADWTPPTMGEESTVLLEPNELAELVDRQRTLMSAHLVVRAPGQGIVEFAMSPLTQTLGFSDDCEIRLPGSALFGRRAADIAPDGSGWAIVATSPLATVKVNGDKVERKHLEDGDMIEIKGVTLRFRGPVGAG